MKMDTVHRQVLAGVLGAITFVAIYLGSNVIFLVQIGVSLVGALLVYFGICFLVDRKLEDNEVEVFPGVTLADQKLAISVCYGAADELRKLSSAVAGSMRETFVGLSNVLRNIGECYETDPEDLVHSYGVVNHHVGELIAIARTYTGLNRKALDPSSKERLGKIQLQIEAYVPHLESIYTACLENDFSELEVKAETFRRVMQIEAPVDPGRGM